MFDHSFPACHFLMWRIARARSFNSLSQDQSTVARRAETTVAECSQMSRDSLLVDGRIHDRKVASSNRGRTGGRIFFCGVNFTCRLLFGVCSVSVLPHWHVKDPGHSVKSAGSRLHLNMHTPFIQRSQSRLTLLLSRHSVHNNIDVMTKFCLRPGTSFDWYLCLQTSTASDEVTYSLSLIHI